MCEKLSYYTGHDSTEPSFLGRVEEKYGSYLEDIKVREKYFLIQSIAVQLSMRSPGDVRNELFYLACDIAEKLSTREQLGLMEAIVAQVKESQEKKTINSKLWKFYNASRLA